MNPGDEYSNENFKGGFSFEFTPIIKRLSCRPPPAFPMAMIHHNGPLPVAPRPCLMPNYLPLGLLPPPPLPLFYNRSPNVLSHNDFQGSLLRSKPETSLPGFLNPLDQVSSESCFYFDCRRRRNVLYETSIPVLYPHSKYFYSNQCPALRLFTVHLQTKEF